MEEHTVRGRVIQWGICCFLCLFLLGGCDGTGTAPVEPDSGQAQESAQPFFGLDFPPSYVTRFAPHIFNEELHSAPIFTPDGREVYWSQMEDPKGLRYMKIENGAWTDPAPAPFDRLKQGDSPFISSDGTQLLYLAWTNTGRETIRRVIRENGEWGRPEELPDEVNQNEAHWQASLADNRNLYFGKSGEIYFSQFADGDYAPAEVLDLTGSLGGGYAGSPFIAPDESYLIFDAAGSTYADLYICFRNEQGGWDEPIVMDVLNSPAHDLYANVSPDGRFIMFLSSRSGILLPYWIDGAVIAEIRATQGEQ